MINVLPCISHEGRDEIGKTGSLFHVYWDF